MTILHAGSLERVRQIALSDYMPVERTWLGPEVRITAMSFSPDEAWIAAAVSPPGPAQEARLIIVSRERSASNLKFSAKVPAVGRALRAFGRLAWSPGGDVIATGGEKPMLIRLADERFCRLESGQSTRGLLGGFVSSTEVVTAEETNGRWTLVVYGADCAPKLHRDLTAAAVSLDASAAGARILVATSDNRVTVYDAPTGKILKSWNRAVTGEYRFMAGGTAVCTAVAPEKSRDEPQCWALTDETNVREPAMWGGAPFTAASDGTLAAFTDGKYDFDPFFETGRQRVRGAALWDFETTKVVTRWRPETYSCTSFKMLDQCETAAVFAVSPKGNYLAESRSGEIRVYRVKSR
jgi:WD40 repeat protein